MKHYILNNEDGINQEISLTEKEIKDRETQFAAEQLLKTEQEAAETTKAEAKAALLARLGITAEEAALLLGGN